MLSKSKYTFKAERKRKYHRESRMSKAEIMVIMILFHSSGYRCLKHFYLEKVCKHMRHLFPEVVSYNRWSSESRSQTCLDYAESRQRKAIVNQWSSESRPQTCLDYAEISCKREQSQALCRVQPIFNEVNRDRGRRSSYVSLNWNVRLPSH